MITLIINDYINVSKSMIVFMFQSQLFYVSFIKVNDCIKCSTVIDCIDDSKAMIELMFHNHSYFSVLQPMNILMFQSQWLYQWLDIVEDKPTITLLRKRTPSINLLEKTNRIVIVYPCYILQWLVYILKLIIIVKMPFKKGILNPKW